MVHFQKPCAFSMRHFCISNRQIPMVFWKSRFWKKGFSINSLMFRHFAKTRDLQISYFLQRFYGQACVPRNASRHGTFYGTDFRCLWQWKTQLCPIPNAFEQKSQSPHISENQLPTPNPMKIAKGSVGLLDPLIKEHVCLIEAWNKSQKSIAFSSFSIGSWPTA